MRMIYRQLREKHPLLQMIEGCLDFPEDRPRIRDVSFGYNTHLPSFHRIFDDLSLALNVSAHYSFSTLKSQITHTHTQLQMSDSE